MNKWIFAFGLSGLLICNCCCAKKTITTKVPQTAEMAGTAKTDTIKEVSSNTLIIFYDAAVGKHPLMKAVEQKHCTLLYDYKSMNGIAIRIPDNWPIRKAIKYFYQVKGVVQVNRDRICHLD
jgi:hypothetical protein